MAVLTSENTTDYKTSHLPVATGAEAEPWAEKGPEGTGHKAVRADTPARHCVNFI